MSEALNGIVEKLLATSAVTAAASGGIYPKLAPEGKSYPLITVWPQQAPQAGRVFQQVAYEESVFLVKAISTGTSPKTAHDIAKLIRAALDLQTLTLDTKTHIAVAWLADFDYTEHVKGVTYHHEGGFYQVTTS